MTRKGRREYSERMIKRFFMWICAIKDDAKERRGKSIHVLGLCVNRRMGEWNGQYFSPWLSLHYPNVASTNTRGRRYTTIGVDVISEV